MAVAAPRKVINRRVRYEAEHAASTHSGHPFFPYAMFHDTVVNLVVVLVIVAMAVIWHATAGPINHAHPTGQAGWLGELYQTKANPAVQATEPRPDWYFLFLFELLRIFKTPWQLIFATIIIPTIMMVLLVAWPFIDRGRDRRLSRRPGGVALGLTVPTVLIALTLAGSVAPGALTGSDVTKIPALNALPGAALASEAGCTTCHNFGAVGVAGPGANLTNGSPKFGTNQAQIQAWIGGGAHAAGTVMPDFSDLGKKDIAELAQLVASLKAGKVLPIQS
jgi:quinol---cytochrome c reductase cytochrome c subunit, bacillus type